MMPGRTRTSDFGMSKRESHDASAFYGRNLYGGAGKALIPGQLGIPAANSTPVPPKPREEWVDRIYCQTAEDMSRVPDESVALAFTSPPYNTGKRYDQDLNLEEYLQLITRVGAEVYRVLVPGGRYVVNIANLGRAPYIPMHAHFYACHMALGFQVAGEVIWQKGKGMSGSCAWGSWLSAKAPRLRDIHEYLLVFVKDGFGRPDKGESDISKEDFLAATLSIWEIRPESARVVGHPRHSL